MSEEVWGPYNEVSTQKKEYGYDTTKKKMKTKKSTNETEKMEVIKKIIEEGVKDPNNSRFKLTALQKESERALDVVKQVCWKIFKKYDESFTLEKFLKKMNEAESIIDLLSDKGSNIGHEMTAENEQEILTTADEAIKSKEPIIFFQKYAYDEVDVETHKFLWSTLADFLKVSSYGANQDLQSLNARIWQNYFRDHMQRKSKMNNERVFGA